jgi:predicted permease
MQILLQDLVYAARTLRKTPGFLTVAVLTLALGIGANLAIFTLVDAVLLQPLPFHDPDRLVRVFDDLNGAGAKDVGLSVPELEDLRDRSGAFEQISVIYPISVALSGGDRVERLEMLGTSPNYFEMLGAKAALGHTYVQADWQPGFLDGVIISDGLWKRQFGGDPHVIGRRIRADEDGYTIVGVMPPDFRHPGPTLNGDVELWAACGLVAAPFPSPPVRASRNLPGAIGRLKRGVTLQAAQSRLDAMSARLTQSFPREYPAQQRWSLRLDPVQSDLTGNVRPMLVILLGAVSFVLLIVCVNIASLLIARASGRMREFAIRLALGASRSRLVRQMLTESVLLSLAGGTAALVVLRVARVSLLAMMPPDVPRLSEIHADWRMAGMALLLSLLTGAVFGLEPALHASSMDPQRDLKEGGRSGATQSVRQNRARSVLVVMEVALSVVLSIGAGLLIRSFGAMLEQKPGFEPAGVTAAQIWIPVPNNPNANRYLRQPQRAQLARNLLSQITAIPGVDKAAVGVVGTVPYLSNTRNTAAFSFTDGVTGRPDDHSAEFGSVSPDYFEALNIPLKRGRAFNDHDAETAPRVTVVNEAFARTFSSNRDVIGRRMRIFGAEFEIVGVTGDLRDHGLDISPLPRIYASIFQRSGPALAVFLRTRTNAAALKEPLARAVHNVDPELPVFGVRTMDELMSASMARRRFAMFLISGFAAVALVLAALGIYGVMAFLVSQRIQEFGIRSALGAQPRDILMLAFRPGLMLTLTGIAAGLVASIGVARLISGMLFGISAADPVIFATVPLVLVLVTLAACFLPARRAIRVDPAQALRS